MINIYKSNCNGLSVLTADNIEKGSWINLINPTLDELSRTSEVTGINMEMLKAALDEEERSRTEIEDGCLLVITNIPVMRAKAGYDTLPLGIIIAADHFVTVCLENNEVLAEFSEVNAKLFSTFKKTRFLFQILYKSAAYYLRYLKQINRRTDEIETHLRKSMKNQELFDLLDLQKGLTYFSVSLRSNGIVLERLLRMRSNSQMQHLIKMYEEDEDLLEDVIIENKQAIEMVEMYTHILNGMMDTFASIISNNLNIVMKFLASMTIILAIPTMISSFFGMNVPVPFADAGHGFLYIVIIALLLTIIVIVGLSKKRML